MDNKILLTKDNATKNLKINEIREAFSNIIKNENKLSISNQSDRKRSFDYNYRSEKKDISRNLFDEERNYDSRWNDLNNNFPNTTAILDHKKSKSKDINDQKTMDEMDLAISCALTPSKDMDVLQRNGLILFEPQKQHSEKGLIIYPGALGNAEVYAPLAREIASYGYKVALVKMPNNLSVLGINRANRVIKDKDFQDIKKWAIAGHSLGGAMAAVYAKSHSKIEGIVFWGAYPAVNLSNTNLKSISIVGSKEVYLDRFKKYEFRLPQKAKTVVINGGNHANFGYYGNHPGDGNASISREKQHKLVASKTSEFLKML